MTVTLKRMQPGDDLDFTDIAPDVFDQPIDLDRLAAYLSEPGHLISSPSRTSASSASAPP